MYNYIKDIAVFMYNSKFCFTVISMSTKFTMLSIFQAIFNLALKLSFCNSVMVFLVACAFAVAIIVGRAISIYYGMNAIKKKISK